MYADDSIAFSDKPITTQPPEDTGIEISKEKSGYIRQGGSYLKPLKFLGLEYDGRVFRARTRKGSRLVLPSSLKFLSQIFSHIQDERQMNSPQEVLEFLESISSEHAAGESSGELLIKGLT